MLATEFEYRHRKRIHQIIVMAAFLTYLIDRENIVWRFVKDSATPHTWERVAFIIATLFIAAGVGICTWAWACGDARTTRDGEQYRAANRSRYLGEMSYAIGLASLAPLAGFFVLVAGEGLRIVRLVAHKDRSGQYARQRPLPELLQPAKRDGEKIHFRWGEAIRREAVKWGILVTMIVFLTTLDDWHADVLAVVSFVLGNLLNARIFDRAAVEKYEADS